MKTWFANARRRIHKGGGSLPGKGSHSAFEIKDHGRKPLMSRSDALDSYASLNLPPDAVSSCMTVFLSGLSDKKCSFLQTVLHLVSAMFDSLSLSELKLSRSF